MNLATVPSASLTGAARGVDSCLSVCMQDECSAELAPIVKKHQNGEPSCQWGGLHVIYSRDACMQASSITFR